MSQTEVNIVIRSRHIGLASAVACIALLAAGSALAVSAVGGGVEQGTMGEQTMQLRAGDVIARRTETGWAVTKILAIDVLPDGEAVAHCLMYRDAPGRPDLASSATLSVLTMHAPIRAASFSAGWERLGNSAVTPGEQAGFTEYLKQTDFPRYLAFTNQEAGPIVSEANRLYRRGIELGEAGNHHAAIVEYDKAIELFPLFFEAIDNKAFTYMDMGQYAEALVGFDQSLRVNPDGMAAFFSRGECLMRLDRLEEAEAVFLEGRDRFPEQRVLFTDFLQQVRAARGIR